MGNDCLSIDVKTHCITNYLQNPVDFITAEYGRLLDKRLVTGRLTGKKPLKILADTRLPKKVLDK